MHELLLQSLDVERGGIQIYEAAVECAIDDELREEWQRYLQQTRRHEQIVIRLLEELGLEEEESPGRKVVRTIGQGLVDAIRQAQQAGDAEAAQLVAAECIVLAETKDHLDWALISELAKQADSAEGHPLREAADQVEDEEDEHLYHASGWTRELWLANLGLEAVLPPPEETQHVKTALAEARVFTEAGERSGRKRAKRRR